MYYDDPSIALSRFIGTQLAGDDSHSLGVVLTYDDVTNTATVQLQPSGMVVGPMPVGVSQVSWAPGLQPGWQVLVALDHGIALAVESVLHSDLYGPPSGGVTLETDLWVSGTVRGDNFAPARYFDLPTATPALRGKIILVSSTDDATVGTADHLYICLQDATGALAWVQIG